MRISIIGLPGSGKTVLLTMLSRYIAGQRGGTVIEPGNYETSQYIAKTQAALDEGEWPQTTLPGEVQLLRWRFGRSVKALHDLEMWDFSGQDFRDIFNNYQTGLTSKQQDIRDRMDKSDALFYLLDLEELMGCKDTRVLNDRMWPLTTFLTRPEWGCKKRTLILSKADIFSAALRHAQGNCKEVIKANLPQIYSMHHRIDSPSIDCFAIASLNTTMVLKDGGAPIRMPMRPLTSENMDLFVRSLLAAAEKPCLASKALESARDWLKSGADFVKNAGNGSICSLKTTRLPRPLRPSADSLAILQGEKREEPLFRKPTENHDPIIIGTETIRRPRFPNLPHWIKVWPRPK